MSGRDLPRARLLALLQDLIRIPSLNPILVPARPAGEAAVAEFARHWLRDAGVDAWLEEAAPGRPNVVAQVGGDNGPTLVLCAHLDTVDASGMSIPPFEPRLEGDRVYGRGAYDMKGGVAASMAAIAAMAGEPPAGRVMLALVADEEDSSLGATHFTRHHAADGCIVTEPTEERLVVAHKGFVWFEMTTRGRAAHGSRWAVGVSAIGRMATVIRALEDHDRVELRGRTHPLVGPASLHCALIEGGSGISTYAAECRMQVERRTVPGEAAGDVARELAEVAARADPEVEVRMKFARDPMECDADAAVVRAIRGALADHGGSLPADTGVAFWTDAAIFAAAGIPAVNFGPVGEGAHAAVEWVDLASVERCARILTDAARRFCS